MQKHSLTARAVTLKAVATSMQIPLKSATITAEGDLDFRGTLGVDRSAKVGFEAIRVKFDLDCGDEDRAKVSVQSAQSVGTRGEQER